MTAVAPLSHGLDSSPLQGAPFLAADIGGTHARLALVKRAESGDVELLAHQKYIGAEYPSLESIINDFLCVNKAQVSHLAIATPGVLQRQVVINNNLPWMVSLTQLRSSGLGQVRVVNDFTAVAYATQSMSEANTSWLGGYEWQAQIGPTLVVGPGTGFGTALRLVRGDEVVVLPSEAGQMAWAPGTAREMQVLALMQQTSAHVSVEQVVSGPGLLKVYRALCVLDGVAPIVDQPAVVAEAARGGANAQAREALDMFCAVFGSLLGDLVVATLATSIYVAGGIITKLRELIPESDFQARFLNKGVMRQVLEQVPIRLIEDPHKGVIGAASWYLQTLR